MAPGRSLMASLLIVVVVVVVVVVGCIHGAIGACSDKIGSAQFTHCIDLAKEVGVGGSGGGASLSWTIHSTNNTLDIAFSDTAISPLGWVGWGINLHSLKMVGTSALIAFKDTTNNVGLVLPYKLSQSVYTGALLPSSNDLTYLNASLTFFANNLVTIFATLRLPANLSSGAGSITLNHVWNRGPSVANRVPAPHAKDPASLQGVKAIDMTTGVASSSSSSSLPSNIVLKYVHGVVSVASWGIMFPLGAMFARFLSSLPCAQPAWFYAHVVCQSIAYILATLGWAIGLRLGDMSQGIVHHGHRYIGISLFLMSTLQVLALKLRPHKEHKRRKFWNVYHHTLGYLIIFLGGANIFKGFNILQPPSKFKVAYIGVVISLAFTSIWLEALEWCRHFFNEKRSKRNKSSIPTRMSGIHAMNEVPTNARDSCNGCNAN